MSVRVANILYNPTFTFGGIDFYIITATNSILDINTTKRVLAFAVGGYTGTNAQGYGVGNVSEGRLTNERYSISQTNNTAVYLSTRCIVRADAQTNFFDLQARFPDLPGLDSLHTPQATLILYMVPLAIPTGTFNTGALVQENGGTVSYLGGYADKLEYYYVTGTGNILIDNRMHVKAFFKDGDTIKIADVLNSSIYVHNNKLYNFNSQIIPVNQPIVGRITDVNDINIPLNNITIENSCILLALSPTMRTGPGYVSNNGMELTPLNPIIRSNFGVSRDIITYLITNSCTLSFDTDRPITCYYIGAGGDGGKPSAPGSSVFRTVKTRYYHANIEYLYGHSNNGLWLAGGGAGGGGGGGGGRGAVGKIAITSKYLHCNISSTGTEVFTEDRYLGIATSGSNGTDGIFDTMANGTADADSFGNYYGGNKNQKGISSIGYGGNHGTLLNSYTGTLSISNYTGSTATRGGYGGKGESSGFNYERSVNGILRASQLDGRESAAGESITVNGETSYGGNPGDRLYHLDWDSMYLLTQYGSPNVSWYRESNGKYNVDTSKNFEKGKIGNYGKSGRGWGAGKGGEGGKGSDGYLKIVQDNDIKRRETWTDDFAIGAAGGGGGAGGFGSDGFSLNKEFNETRGLLVDYDKYSSSNGCVIIVIG